MTLSPKKVALPPRTVAAGPRRGGPRYRSSSCDYRLLGQGLVTERMADVVACQPPPAHSSEMRGGERNVLVDDQFSDLLDRRHAGLVGDVIHEVPVVVVQLRLGVHEVTEEQPLRPRRLQQKDGRARGVPARFQRADAREQALRTLEELHA